MNKNKKNGGRGLLSLLLILAVFVGYISEDNRTETTGAETNY